MMLFILAGSVPTTQQETVGQTTNSGLMETLPVLLDTDIGSDIDDAVALAYLLRQPRCELLGITTVTGEPGKRASLADAICQAAGRTDIPIHVGLAAPLQIEAKQPRAEQAEALTDEWPHRTFRDENPTAIEFLRETIRSRPGEITLLPIGPLTNIAVLFQQDPEIPRLLKQVVMMGGWFYEPKGEWNIINDPHAAQIVFASPLPRLIAVGIDVTQHCRLSADECRRRFSEAGGPLGMVAAMAEVWFRDKPAITFHDPLAAALLFEPTLCETELRHVTVALDDPDTLGRTRLTLDNTETPHEIAKSVDPAAFFAHYFEVVGNEGS